MAFTPVKKNAGSNVDWEYVNSQIEDCIDQSNDARIAVLVDLGIHAQGDRVSKDGITMVSSEEEALDLIDKAQDIVGDYILQKEGYDQYEELDGPAYKLDFKIVKDQWVFPSTDETDNATYVSSEKEAKALLERAKELDTYSNLEKAGVDGYEEIETPFKLSFNIYDGGDQREFGILADLVDTEVEYIKGSGNFVNYRVNLCSTFDGKMTGFMASTNYSPLSVVNKLCKATGNKHILKDTTKLTDLVGSPYFQVLEEKKGFINVSKNFGTPRAKDIENIPPLNIEGFEDGVVISFEDVTLEELTAAKLNKLYVEKIKSASNYEGSHMQKIMEKWEATRSQSTKDKEVDEEEEQQPQRKPKKPKREEAKEEEPEEKVKKKSSKKKVVEEEEEDPFGDEDDSPF